MKVPKEKLRYSAARQGQGGRGSVTVNLRGMDLEGLNELTISLDDVDALAGRGPDESDEVRKLRNLLGG